MDPLGIGICAAIKGLRGAVLDGVFALGVVAPRVQIPRKYLPQTVITTGTVETAHTPSLGTLDAYGLVFVCFQRALHGICDIGPYIKDRAVMGYLYPKYIAVGY